MGTPNLVNGRLSELNAGIINILDNRIEVHGFLSKDRLQDYLTGISCRYSLGYYPLMDIDESVAQDDAMFIFHKNGTTEYEVEYNVIFTETLTFKLDSKIMNRTIKIRKSKHSDKYHLLALDVDMNFQDMNSLNQYLFDNYSISIESKALEIL